MDAFHEIAATFTEKFFQHPEIAAHRSAWNIHRVDIPAGVDPTNLSMPGSRFGTQLNCRGLDRFVSDFIAENNRLGLTIYEQYLN